MKIDPHRLKYLREAKGLSRKKLAEASNVSTKQIQRLEDTHRANGTSREFTVTRLSRALDVCPGVLSGQEPLPGSVSPYAPPSVSVTRRLLSEAMLAYDLVERRYGVTSTAIMNAAPLFFVLLAEGSLAWRREELDEIRKAIKHVCDLGDGSNRKVFATHAFNASNDSYYEDEAIEQQNLFDDPFPDDYRFSVHSGSTTNPFIEYLQKLAEDLNCSGMEVDEGFVSSHTADGMPAYSVCRDELERIVPLDSRAFSALQTRDVRITDIPPELTLDRAARRREEWLENKLSDKTTEWLEERDSLDKLLKELGILSSEKSPSDHDTNLIESNAMGR